MKRNLKPHLYRVLLLFWMILIFFFSHQPGERSEDMSHNVGMTFGRIFIKDFGKKSDKDQAEFAARIDFFIRKGAHVTEYIILGILFCLVFSNSSGIKDKAVTSVSAASGIAYSITDEIHQLFIQGRSGQATDVLIDSCGVIIGVILMRMILKSIGKSRK